MNFRTINLLVRHKYKYHYLCSTNKYRTIREAVEWFMNEYQGRVYVAVSGACEINKNVHGIRFNKERGIK